MLILSCENEFDLHVNEISFSYERISTKTRFEEEAKSNSEMAYYTNNSLHLARKDINNSLHYAKIFGCGHYPFREANSFPRGTDNVQGQISELTFAPNEGYCVNYL